MYSNNFKYANYKYCTAFYDSQVLPMFNSCMEEIYIAWRVATSSVLIVNYFHIYLTVCT